MKDNERFLRSCLNKKVDRPPVWLMRQAGRYLPEYRSFKKKHSTKAMMTTPDIASDITVQPVSILGVDAAILYSDILMLPDAMGMGLSFVEGEGPVFDFSIQTYEDLHRLNTDAINKKLSFVFDTIKLSLKKLPKDFPLIGFAGAPFTVAAYMISGQHKLNFTTIKNFAWTQPAVYEQLLTLITQTTIDYLLRQHKAGVTAVQLFDTWAGELSCEDYEKLALPYSKKIFEALQKDYVPNIHYIKNNHHLLPALLNMPSDAISLDWRTSLANLKKQAGDKHAFQGNFDPDLLFATPSIIEKRLRDMVADIPNPCKGYIVNLGHGVKPETPVKNVMCFVENAKKIFC